MNFYYLKALLSRLLMTTEKFEKVVKAMPDKTRRYHAVETSNELREYKTLNDLFASGPYAENQKKAKQLEQLRTNRKVKLYNRLLLNKDLQDFLRFVTDPEHMEQLQDADAVKASAELQRMKKVEKSSNLRAWQGLEQSAEVLQYLQLRKEVIDYSKELKRLKELSANDDIQFFLSQDKSQIQRFDSVEQIYEEDFDVNPMGKSWQAGFVYPSADFKSVHSYTNEVQSYVGGANVEVHDSKLLIHTRKSKNQAPAWHPTKGMIMTDFDYTSDVINNKDQLVLTEGSIVQVKAQCHGFLNHGIYLRSANHVPFISVFNYTGLKMYCGLKSNVKDEEYLHELEGLQPLHTMIFTVVWTKEAIVWYVNNLEVHRVKNTIPKGEKMYLHMYSFQFKDKYVTEGSLEVDWIKAYKIK